MNKRLMILLAVLGAVVLIVGAFQAWYYLSGGGGSAGSPQELAQEALNGATVEERSEAAVALADHQYAALEEMRRVLQESDTPAVKATCIEGLGAIQDVDSVDTMLQLLDDPSPVVSGTAAAVATGIIRGPNSEVKFKVDTPEAEKKQFAKELRDEWDEARDSPRMNLYRRRLQEGRENET